MALNLVTFKPLGRTPSSSAPRQHRLSPSKRRKRTRLPLEQVFTLVGSDVRDGGKDVGAVGCAPLDAVAVVDATLARFVVDIEVL